MNNDKGVNVLDEEMEALPLPGGQDDPEEVEDPLGMSDRNKFKNKNRIKKSRKHAGTPTN